MQARVLGNGCELWNGNARLRLNQLLFADDAALVADSVRTCRECRGVWTRVYKEKTKCINVDKCKVLRCAREVQVGDMNIRLNGEVLETVQMFISILDRM